MPTLTPTTHSLTSSTSQSNALLVNVKNNLLLKDVFADVSELKIPLLSSSDAKQIFASVLFG